MAATPYLFLLTISLASGAFYPVHQNGSPSKGQPFPKLSVSPQMFLDNCRFRRSSALQCYIELQHIFRRFRVDLKPEIERHIFNARSSIQGILSKNNKQTYKHEIYINSILDEDKRDASNFNASDSALNSTWIEVKDPRKTATPIKSEITNEEKTDEIASLKKENIVITVKPIKSEIANEKSTDEFVSLEKENIVITEKPIKSEIANEEETDEFVSFKEENTIMEKTDPSTSKEKKEIINGTAAGGSNTIMENTDPSTSKEKKEIINGTATGGSNTIMENTDSSTSKEKKEIINGTATGGSNTIMEKTDPSTSKEKKEIINGTATGGSNANGETTIQIQQTTTITESSDVVTSAKADKSITIIRETSDITPIKEVTERKISAKQNTTSTVDTDEGNKRNTNDQKETTGASSSENVEKSTAADLHTDSAKTGFKVTTETTTISETAIEVTTGKISEDTGNSLSTESRSISTSVMPEDTTPATDDLTTSIVFTTKLSTDPTKSESASDADISPSRETDSATSSSTGAFPSASVTGSSGYKTESSDGGFTSTMITDLKSSNGDYVTKAIPVVPEHTINIRSIRIAKVVLSVLLLVTGLIAVVMLAVYLFRVRRGAVQYDQLTLLP